MERYYDKQNRRLIYRLTFPGQLDALFWDRHWKTWGHTTMLASAARGALGALERPLVRYLPRTGRILEAGCGLGQFVLALRNRGYDVAGVEWEEETVSFIKRSVSDLPVRAGDVTRLDDVPDGTSAGTSPWVSWSTARRDQSRSSGRHGGCSRMTAWLSSRSRMSTCCVG